MSSASNRDCSRVTALSQGCNWSGWRPECYFQKIFCLKVLFCFFWGEGVVCVFFNERKIQIDLKTETRYPPTASKASKKKGKKKQLPFVPVNMLNISQKSSLSFSLSHILNISQKCWLSFPPPSLSYLCLRRGHLFTIQLQGYLLSQWVSSPHRHPNRALPLYPAWAWPETGP